MLNLVSLLIGAIAAFLAIFAFFPLLGWANWFIIPVAMVGALLGFLSRSNMGRNLNLFVILIAVVRLSLGGGII